jgi:methyl acetate hydrolase
MILPQPGPNGRGAGSLTWGGTFNSYNWVDPQRRVAAVQVTQFLPFDPRPLKLYGARVLGFRDDMRSPGRQPPAGLPD